MTRCAQYNDLIKIPTQDNGESLVIVQEAAPDIKCQYEKLDMIEYFGHDMYLRKSVVEKLKNASVELRKEFPEYQFKLVYAYRHPEVQEKYFKIQKEKINNGTMSEEDINERVHMFIASPDVAGHPTGAAIDITITTKDGDLDMGTDVADFSNKEKINTFYKGLTDEQKNNRDLLRKFLIDQGFAPFDFEWWHFSYGDKDWAYYYEEPSAIYDKISIKA